MSARSVNAQATASEAASQTSTTTMAVSGSSPAPRPLSMAAPSPNVPPATAPDTGDTDDTTGVEDELPPPPLLEV